MKRMVLWGLPLVMVLMVGLSLGAESLWAQAEAMGQQRLGRPYWHVFLAYALAWAMILGWVVSIARRLGRVESRLQDSSD